MATNTKINKYKLHKIAFILAEVIIMCKDNFFGYITFTGVGLEVVSSFLLYSPLMVHVTKHIIKIQYKLSCVLLDYTEIYKRN